MRPEGFAPIPTWMLRDKSISRRACLVYASLSSRSGLGAIYPSQETIAEETGVSIRTVRAAILELEDLGVVERRTRRGREGRANGLTTAYVLHPNGRLEEPADIAGRSERPATSDRATGKNEQGTPLIEAENQEAEGRKRAHRIPEPFIVTGEMRKWAVEEVPGVDVDASTRVFVDYWRAESGAKASKRDWVAAWRNWLRKDAPARGRQTFAQQKQNNTLDLIGRLREKEQADEALGSGGDPRVRELARGA